MKQLLKAEGVLTPCCSRTHISYSFFLPSDTDRLDIFFSYSPKILQDTELGDKLIKECLKKCGADFQEVELDEGICHLKNLLTVSVRDGTAFRGAAHRHSPKQHQFIAVDQASDGFIPGPICKGLWRVTISVHAVLTDCCRYKLEICEGKSND